MMSSLDPYEAGGSKYDQRRKGRRRTTLRSNASTGRQNRLVLFVLVFGTGLYIGFLWRAEMLLERLEKGPQNGILVPIQDGRKRETASAPSVGTNATVHVERVALEEGKASAFQTKRYILFNGFLGGQGLGNIMNGLLAAHLLGQEFDRIVCVGNKFGDFSLAFEPIYPPQAVEDCPDIAAKASEGRVQDKHITLNNFGKVPNECELKEILSSHAVVVVITGNTYPRWPVVPDNFFFTFYKAKRELVDIIPYNANDGPGTVVHLREPDKSGADVRKGLDEDTFSYLGKELPSSTFLVTNRVEWFDYFESNYHWRHPDWQTVFHSAMKNQDWGLRQLGHRKEDTMNMDDKEWHQKMQMWADWYTILTAEKVYHTHSDFSISAIHWQNLPSQSIVGPGQYVDESWRVDGETTPLKDRREDSEGASKLRKCVGSNQDIREHHRRKRDRREKPTREKKTAKLPSGHAMMLEQHRVGTRKFHRV